MTRLTDDEIVAEIEVLTHDAKLGTGHEFHDGWTFELDMPRPATMRLPRRVLRCGCGALLVAAPVTVRDTRIVWYPAPDQPDGVDTGPLEVGVYTYTDAQQKVDDLRARQERRGEYRLEPT
ncbi:hypothetical protein SEA_PHAUCI_51 [Gordonia Phage Phauci]|uniref:Uncharacterized protein n=1 Tax=Gordonia Phage Phauci TaxID=2951392 RepID=A0A9E7NKM5_9CAUD|nr:hypothetical protein SEA_PHAUCI_51 [Gordonia Phage Phauci]